METKNQIELVFQEMSTKVDESLGSLFTKDDVKKIINMLSDNINEIEIFSNEDDDKFENFMETIQIKDFVELDNLKFGIENSDTITLDSYDIWIDNERLSIKYQNFKHTK